MATIRASLPHEDRTATEPRENRVEPVILAQIREINDRVRVIRLRGVDPEHTIQVRNVPRTPHPSPLASDSDENTSAQFLPGQWLDTFIPGLRAGGFTITSTPADARPSRNSAGPYLELAIQKSENPPAKWLWRPEAEIQGTPLAVRVGGSFTWPPPGLDVAGVRRLVLVAGGVGVK
jgi:hypothetical protein